MSSSLNLSNNEIGFFNDIYMLQNTGQSSIYNIFGSKTDVSNLAGMSTTTLSDITSAITALSTVSSALETKATITSVSNINLTLPSLITSSTLSSNLNNYLPLSTYNNTVLTRLDTLQDDTDNNSASVIGLSITQQSILPVINNTIPSMITGISNINTTLPSLISFNTWNSNIFPTISNIYSASFLSIGSKLLIDQNTTNISNLTNTVNSTITSISNINSTIPSLVTFDYLTTNYWNTTLDAVDGKISLNNGTQRTYLYNTLGSYLLTTAFNNTLTSSLSSYSTITTVSNLNSTVNSNITLISNINNTIPSLLLTSNFNSTIGSYLLTSAFNNTLTSNLNNYTPLATYNNTITTRLNAHDTSLTNINNTLPSLLSTSSFNSTISSYLQTSNFNTTIGNYLLTTAFNNTLTSNLNNYTPLATYNNTITTRLNAHDTSLTNINNTLPSLITSSTLTSTLTGYPAYTFDGTNNNITSGNVRYINWISTTTNSLLIDKDYNTIATFRYAGSTLNSQLNAMSNLTVAGNITTSGQTHMINGTAQNADVSLTLRNFASGTSSLYLNSNNTVSSRIYQDPSGNINFTTNISNTSNFPLQILNNGVVRVGGTNSVQKKLSLFDQSPNDAVTSATNFFGLGLDNNALRYQVGGGDSSHKFYCATSLYFTITNQGGANGSDISLKTSISNITDAISTITQLQGITYTLKADPTNTRQMGFIANDVANVVPEVVVPTDDGNGNSLTFMVYCKLTALLTEGIKEQQITINNNISSISYLNTTISNNISSISYLNTVIDNNVSSITSLTTRVSILEGN